MARFATRGALRALTRGTPPPPTTSQIRSSFTAEREALLHLVASAESERDASSAMTNAARTAAAAAAAAAAIQITALETALDDETAHSKRLSDRLNSLTAARDDDAALVCRWDDTVSALVGTRADLCVRIAVVEKAVRAPQYHDVCESVRAAAAREAVSLRAALAAMRTTEAARADALVTAGDDNVATSAAAALAACHAKETLLFTANELRSALAPAAEISICGINAREVLSSQKELCETAAAAHLSALRAAADDARAAAAAAGVAGSVAAADAATAAATELAALGRRATAEAAALRGAVVAAVAEAAAARQVAAAATEAAVAAAANSAAVVAAAEAEASALSAALGECAASAAARDSTASALAEAATDEVEKAIAALAKVLMGADEGGEAVRIRLSNLLFNANEDIAAEKSQSLEANCFEPFLAVEAAAARETARVAEADVAATHLVNVALRRSLVESEIALAAAKMLAATVAAAAAPVVPAVIRIAAVSMLNIEGEDEDEENLENVTSRRVKPAVHISAQRYAQAPAHAILDDSGSWSDVDGQLDT